MRFSYAQDQCLRYVPSMLDTCTAHWLTGPISATLTILVFVLRPRLFGENVAWTWPQESVSTGFNIDRSQDTVELTTLPVGLLLLMLFKVRKRQASCLRLSGSAETSLNLRIAPIDHVIKEQGRVGNDCTWTYANRT